MLGRMTVLVSTSNHFQMVKRSNVNGDVGCQFITIWFCGGV